MADMRCRQLSYHHYQHYRKYIHQHLNLPRNPFQHRQQRGVFSMPRAVFSILRLPIAMASAGAGAAGFAYYKATEASNSMIPDWVKDSFQKAKAVVNSIDLPHLELPDVRTIQTVDMSSPSAEYTLPGVEEASKTFHRMSDGASSIADIIKTSSSALSSSSQMPSPDHELMILTKKLIEIRNLLKGVNQGKDINLVLPSIVVVGSQSSGKSSVLEAIVGHEFLPKGNNMVTRRPIELTLIHNSESQEEFSEFPQLGLGKIVDFRKVQKTLADLNLAVSDTECVSSNPIELRIYSPNVPDLTMVDLPGFIQIHNRNQPAALKEKISNLCEAYINEPNIILAVCAADVDLANSEALRASRKADPLGRRTIGVITKLDLVEPERAVNILKNGDYPLELGYIGVVCKAIGASKTTSSSPSKTASRAEDAYFNSHQIFKTSRVSVGIPFLRHRLMQVLEDHMGKGLYRVVDAVQTELEEARYQFKVHYNDRRISPESYVAETMESLKRSFRQFTKDYGKPQVREQLRVMMEKKILDVCEEIYWGKQSPPLAAGLSFSRSCTDVSWQTRVDMASSALAKSGVGRSSVQIVSDTLLENMEKICTSEQWQFHPETRKKILKFASDIVRSRFSQAVDQVENTIKPFKFEVDCTEVEWREGVKRACVLLETAVKTAQKDLQSIKSKMGRRKLRSVMRHIHESYREDLDDRVVSNGPLSLANLDPNVVEQGRRALLLRDKISVLQGRLTSIKSRQCSNSSGRSCCPEVFLEVVAEKLIYHAVMFINVELVNEFFFQLPREIDDRLYYNIGREQILAFANENPAIARHLETQGRKETLEQIMKKLKGISLLSSHH